MKDRTYHHPTPVMESEAWADDRVPADTYHQCCPSPECEDEFKRTGRATAWFFFCETSPEEEEWEDYRDNKLPRDRAYRRAGFDW